MFVAVAFAVSRLSNVGLFVKVYVTAPLELVDTVKLLYGDDDAKKLYNESTLVVATIPFTIVVTTPDAALILFEFIIPAVVLETTPFTVEYHVYELVVVETVSTLVVLAASTAAGETCCISPDGPYTNSPDPAVPVATLVRLTGPDIVVVAKLVVPVAFRLPAFTDPASNVFVIVLLAKRLLVYRFET